MDKYARQSHKTNQRARRRNNTAQYLLDNQLKQLDRERRSGQVTFQRNLNRVKSELSNLEGASSDFSLPLDEGTKQTKSADAEFLRSNDTKYTNRNENKNCDITNPDVFIDKRAGIKLDKRHNVSSPSLMTSSMDDVNTDLSSFPCLASSTPIESNTLPRHFSRKKSQILSRWVSSDDNYPDVRLSHNCNFFPCKLPQTYHALGFRRDDLCPRSDDDLSPQCPNHETDDNLLEIASGRKAKSLADPSSKAHHKSDSISHVNTKWIKTDDESKHKFNPTVHGPVFGYRPTDPVLERIREKRQEPKLNAVRPCARVTIRDRIRGVKQLVKEMKMSNEKIKPEDWATNYGKRVPTRVLLNPVVPV